jgi:hypothetical protein
MMWWGNSLDSSSHLGLAAFDHLSPSKSDGQSESTMLLEDNSPQSNLKCPQKLSIQSVMEVVLGTHQVLKEHHFNG